MGRQTLLLPLLLLALASSSLAMQIMVKSANEKIVLLDVEPADEIESVKKLIELKEGIESSNQRLVFGGKLLNDDKQTVGDAKIGPLSTLHLANRLETNKWLYVRQSASSALLLVRFEGEKFVGELKEEIRDRLGVECSRQRLVFAGRILEDHKSLGDYGVQTGATLILSQEPKSGLQVTIKLITGQTIPIQCRRRDIPVFTLKKQIELMASIGTEKQRLVYLGKELEDQRKLSDYNIQENSTIYLHVPMQTGADLRRDHK